MGALNMTSSVLLLTLALSFGSIQPDTTLSVSPGDILSLENLSGGVRVETWDRDVVEIETQGIDQVRFDVREGGNEFRVRPRDRRGRGHSRSRAYAVRVPRWLPLEIRGRELSISVSGHSGRLLLSTLDGDIDLRDTKGEIRARTLEGTISAIDVGGLVELFSLDDDISVRGATGELRVDVNDGDVTLWEIDAEVVEASSVDGDIDFMGTLHARGRYTVVTHDGDITFGIVGDPNAHVLVSIFEGELESEFPIMLSRLESGREFDFTLGEGAAEVRLEAFDGAVRLERARPRARDHDQNSRRHRDSENRHKQE
jgi:Toastrack DUF4097